MKEKNSSRGMAKNRKLIRFCFLSVLSLVIAGVIAAMAGAAGPPLISSLTSSTHPDENVWYSDANPSFSWFSYGDPALAGTYNTPGHARGVVVSASGTLAYVADYLSGLRIVNVSNPSAPVSSGWVDTPGEALGVAVAGNYAYVADGSAGLRIIDVTNPAAPVLKGSYNTPGTSYGVAVSGNYAYVADHSAGLQIINISNPLAPVLAGVYDTPGYAFSVAVSGNHAYVADNGGYGLQIINISNPTSPVPVGMYDTPGYAYGIAAYANYVYIADYSAGLGVFDVTVPANPVLKGYYNTPGTAVGVSVSGNYAFVADLPYGLQVVDVSNPSVPTLKGNYDTAGQAYGTAVSGNYVYVADEAAGLQVISMSANAGFSFLLDGSALTDPDETIDGTQTSYGYTGIADGEWYFHVRVKDNQGVWGPAAHRRVKIDDNGPAITIIQPTGTISTASAAVYGYLSDGASGVNASSLSVELDGQTLSGCTVTADEFSCTATGLTEGPHSIDVAATDNAGNTGTASGSFDVEFCTAGQPALAPSKLHTYWATYEDYAAHRLSVIFRIDNAGPDSVGTAIVGAVSTNSVEAASGLPMAVGDIAAGASADFTMVYELPAGVITFKSTLYGTAQNACGDDFSYPGPYPQT